MLCHAHDYLDIKRDLCVPFMDGRLDIFDIGLFPSFFLVRYALSLQHYPYIMPESSYKNANASVHDRTRVVSSPNPQL